MSKCREEFEKQFDYDKFGNFHFHVWQVAWNARGKVDTEICLGRADQYATAAESAEYIRDADVWAHKQNEAEDCAEAIEQEDERVL